MILLNFLFLTLILPGCFCSFNILIFDRPLLLNPKYLIRWLQYILLNFFNLYHRLPLFHTNFPTECSRINLISPEKHIQITQAHRSTSLLPYMDIPILFFNHIIRSIHSLIYIKNYKPPQKSKAISSQKIRLKKYHISYPIFFFSRASYSVIEFDLGYIFFCSGARICGFNSSISIVYSPLAFNESVTIIAYFLHNPANLDIWLWVYSPTCFKNIRYRAWLPVNPSF